jgi:glucosamine-6-phosphate deaminase
MSNEQLSSVQYRIFDRLAIEIHPNRANLGRAAARAAAACIRDAISLKGEARVIFACAPSQDEFLAALIDPSQSGIAIDWSKVTAFHMDDYVGLPASHLQSFRSYLRYHLLNRVPIGRFFPLETDRPDIDQVCAIYSANLAERPIDLICLGIGENGHIAFNDPHVADFKDPMLVKLVELDVVCRQQQVNDGCFPTLAEVPTHALTLTIPVFRRARQLSVHVPGTRKANAVCATVLDPITTRCPATILRLHPNATMYLDMDSAGKILGPRCK